jgi:hypothetical protein
VPPVGSAAAADPAARVTSTCGGGGCGRRRNDVDIGPERLVGVGNRFGVSSSVRASHEQTALPVEKFTIKRYDIAVGENEHFSEVNACARLPRRVFENSTT